MDNLNKIKPYFYLDPCLQILIRFETEKERDNAVCDVIAQYSETNEWQEEIEQLVVGKITGIATEVNKQYPDEFSSAYTCDYKIKPLDYVKGNITPRGNT